MSEATTDRELLELAAKAMGRRTAVWKESSPKLWLLGRTDDEHHQLWDPRDDDGDSRRLQVACEIDLTFHEAIDGDYAQARATTRGRSPVLQAIHGAGPLDDDAACRMAVLRAAAAIGKEMK